jgi:hypothetical protein
MTGRPAVLRGPAHDVGTLLRYAAALCTAAAALGHLSAARDHPAHAHVAAFFVVLALGQLGWAAAAAFRPTDRLLRAGAAGNAAVVALWAVSRTTGIPGIPGADHVEAVAVKDAVVTLLEIAALIALGLLVAMPEKARTAILPSPDRAFAGLMAGVLLLSVPAVLGPDGHGAGHGVHGHSQGDVAAHGHDTEGADGDRHAEHALGAASDDHGHADAAVLASHAHGAAASGDHTDHAAAAADGHAHGAGTSTGDDHDGHADHAGDDDHGSHGPGPDDGAAVDSTAWPEGRTAKVRYGPFTLPPASFDPVRGWTPLLTNVVLTDLEPPCRDCVFVAAQPDLVYEDGSRANYDTGAMLHHTVLFDSTRNDPTCPRSTFIGGLGLRVLASGNERTRAAFPSGYGVPIGGNAWFSGIFELMNMTDRTQTVWFSLEVRHRPASAGLKPLTPVWMDVDNCSDSEITVPAGRSTTTWEWESNVTGRVVTTAGHVHDGGLSITLRNASTDQHMCRSVAGYGNDPSYEGAIDRMSVCTWDRLGTVREGERLAIDAVYDTPEPIESAMGIMMAFVYETNDLTGGTPAPSSMTSPPEGPAPPPSEHHHNH